MNFAKFLRTPFLRNTSGRLLMQIQWSYFDLIFLFNVYEKIIQFVRVQVQGQCPGPGFRSSLELYVWMSSFLNIRGSRLEESCKKEFLTSFAKFIEKYKKNRDAVFNLKFQTKRSTTLLKRDSGICAFPRISQKF